MREITMLSRAREGVLSVQSPDETRTEKWLVLAAASATMEVRFWDFAAGVTGIDGKALRDYRGAEQDPDAVLAMVESAEGTSDYPNRCMWVLRDFAAWVTPERGGAATARKLKNLHRDLAKRPVWSSQVIVLIGNAELPADLSAVKTIAFPLPDRAELSDILDSQISALPEVDKAGNPIRQGAIDALSNGTRDAVIGAAVGLSAREAQSSFSKSLVTTRTVDPAAVAAEKERAIADSGMEWLKPLAGGFGAVGGLDVFKKWAANRIGVASSAAAKAYGIESAKGALLVGVPGCGKTYVAMALGGEFGLPVIKLDMGALRGKYVGESEAKVRQAFSTLDAVGPCIVVADEIEKALAGAGGPQGDGGVGADALGTLLSWMNDRTSEAFVIATANDVSALPPELLRKGRFDAAFWVGLPSVSERAAIVRAALRKRGRDADALGIDVDAIADSTDQFSGAELDALVPDSMFAAFSDGAREIATADLLAAAAATRPQALNTKSKVIRERPEFAIDAAAPATVSRTASASAGTVLDLG
jgi:MoxR-like ATPase